MMARQPKLEQAANHYGILKRPEEAASTESPGRNSGPCLGSSRSDKPPDSRKFVPPGACSPLPSVWAAISPGKTWPLDLRDHPPVQSLGWKERLLFLQVSMCIVSGKDSDWPSLSHVPIPEPITVAGSCGHKVMWLAAPSEAHGVRKAWGGTSSPKGEGIVTIRGEAGQKQKSQTNPLPFPWHLCPYNPNTSLGCIFPVG